MHDQVQIEQDVEDDGTNHEHERNLCNHAAASVRRCSLPIFRPGTLALAAGVKPIRSLAKIYFTYSESISLAVPVLAHHGSARCLAVTTRNGTSPTPRTR